MILHEINSTNYYYGFTRFTDFFGKAYFGLTKTEC